MAVIIRQYWCLILCWGKSLACLVCHQKCGCFRTKDILHLTMENCRFDYCSRRKNILLNFHIKPILQVLLVHFIGKKQANRGSITCPRLLLLVNHRTRYQTPISLTPKPKFSTTLLGNLHDDMHVHVRPPGLGYLIITKVPEGLYYVTVLQITYSFIQ